MSFGGNSGGSSSIAGGTDVLLSNPASQQVLAYDGSTAKWINSSLVSTRFNMRGDFATGVAYALNDVINSPGYGRFYCIQAHTSANPAPTVDSTYWKQLGGNSNVSIGTNAGQAADGAVALQTVVYDGTAWPATRASAVARFFISTGYPTAPAPVGIQQCDLWFRDPGAS